MDDLPAPFSRKSRFCLVLLAPLGCCAPLGGVGLPLHLRKLHRRSPESDGRESRAGQKDLSHPQELFGPLKLLSPFKQIPSRPNLLSLGSRRKPLPSGLDRIHHLETFQRPPPPLPSGPGLELHLL